MTTIHITRDPLGFNATVRFAYNADLVDLIKFTVPAGARSWDPAAKAWTVDAPFADILTPRFRALGHHVEDHGRPNPPPPRRPAPPTTWAEQLLTAVGPTRQEAVFRALTRVLHPDTATGDTALMQQLNNARAQLKGAA